MRCFSSAPKKTYFLLLFFIAFFTLRFLLMLRTASLWVGSRTAPRFDDYVLSTLPSMFPHLIAVCVSLTLPFAMFTTPGLDSVLLRVCSVDLEDGFWSQVWALVSRGLAFVLPKSCCSFLPLLPLV
ncbi:hypothetical protein DY000_02041039 [Brassica cretica]|uniref:Secreted peptide n=1 Tax=Brassica cretica TaxID=69181 RepID=A0ABQ7BDX0_BRACR|nr:hypothetical protein DY000_02041039 [Brassica cretica]